jgi:hypothetical protein
MADAEVISADSAEGVPNYLQFFTTPATNIIIEKTFVQQYNPLETFNETDSNLKFRINGLPDSFIDLNSIRLNFQFRVLNADKSILKDTDPAFPQANVLHTMFKQITCHLNNSTMVTQTHNL